MTTYFYDAVIMGMEIGPLVAGALLAKRGFRVLAIGQNAPTDRYPCFGYEFIRRPFLLSNSESPLLTRIIKELGIGQLYQHATYVPSPVWQAVLPNARLDVNRDLKRIAKEMHREMPGSTENIDDAFDALGRIGGEIHKLFNNDFVLPPESFFEKREFSRIDVQNPFRLPFFSQSSKRANELPEPLTLPLLWSAGAPTQLPPLIHYRQLGGWLFDTVAFYKGRDGFRKLLIDQIVSQGGDVHPRRQATDIIVKRGSVTGIRLAGHDEITGCQMVLTHLLPKDLGQLIDPGSWNKRFRQTANEHPPFEIGYSVNLGMRAEVVPAGMAHTVFYVPKNGEMTKLLRVEKISQPDETRAALNISCRLSADAVPHIHSGEVRDEILDHMRKLVPFLDQYLEVIHSPFDGFGPLDLKGEAKGEAPLVPHTEEIPQWTIRLPHNNGTWNVAGLPHRTGIKGLLLSGDQMVSGLDTEGELLAAWGAARIACKMDPRRERLVKSMLSKVEI